MGHFYTASPTPETLLPSLVEMVSSVGNKTSCQHANISVTTSLNGLSWSHSSVIDQYSETLIVDLLEKLKAHRSIDITRVELEWRQHQGSQLNPQFRLLYENSTTLSATFDISGSSEQTLAVLSHLEAHFSLTRYAASLSAQAALERSAVQLREHSVSDLRAQVVSLGQLMTDLAAQEAQNRARLHKELQDEFASKRDKLDEEMRALRARLDEEHRARMISIEEREQKHRDEVARFDARESKVVRRDVAKQLDTLLIEQEKKISLSPETSRKRRGTGTILVLALAVAVTTMSGFGWKLFEADAFNLHFAVAFGLSSLGFIGTIVYCLKWTDQWTRQHADAEFMAKRYRADMLRATWVAELVAEWQRENSVPVPSSLSEPFVRNLFSYQDTPAATHPLETLTGMLGKHEIAISKSGITVGPPSSK